MQPTGPQTKTIDGLSVTSISLEPADAYDLLPDVAPIFGMVVAAKAGIEAGALDIEGLLAAASQRLGGGRMTELMVRMLRSTTITTPSSEGGTIHRVTDRATLSLAFSGRMWSVFAVAAFAFEVTYGGFSDVVARLPGVKRQPAAAQ
jgi:hypothetical protein